MVGQRGLRAAVVVLDAFTALTAVAGGVLLATGREAERFSTEALRRTPFSDYVVPGWMLGSLVGGTAAVATVATLCSARNGGLASAAAGVVLVGWVVGGELVLDLPHRTTTDRVTDAVYLTIGGAMTVLGAALFRSAKRPQGRGSRPRSGGGGRAPR
jgi:hypothetical protein